MVEFRILTAAAAAVFAFSAAAEDNVMAIRATGFANAGGHAIAKLFQRGDDVLGKGRWEVSSSIQNNTAQFEFRDLPPGAYAIVVFHDANDNGVIDHNALRLPSEALGFSNGFRPGLFAGLPSFEKLQFDHPAGRQQLDIIVK